jgi:DNA-binding NtrC family response regulator
MAPSSAIPAGPILSSVHDSRAYVPTQPVPIPPTLARLCGRSAAMARVREHLGRIAGRDVCVLVSGRSGTGKELAARLLHELSPRRGGPFIAVDCGALAEGLLESELFGHERGSFTGASRDRCGLFEAASGGTLFLDEIGNTTLALQARLLRVLQEREVRRVGGNREHHVDVRVVAATNRDLAQDAAAGLFREDLLWRLDVLSLRMPALAERPEDIPDIARGILVEIASRTGESIRMSATAIERLVMHDWPGNVRELRNALERAAAFSCNGLIDVEDLPERLRSPAAPRGAAPVTAAARMSGGTLQSLLDICERSVLVARLERNAWLRERTATELGITRRTLLNKMIKHGLQPPQRSASME